MTEQLFDTPTVPKLTDRQQRALDIITAAGWDGVKSGELGAALHHPKHPLNDRCDWCLSAGQQVGAALRAKRLVQQRRRETATGVKYLVWTVAGDLRKRVDRDYQLPEGF